MEITIELVKQLRDATGVSITECKNALSESGGDLDKAVEIMRKKGISKAGKRADNATKEGLVKIEVSGGKAYVAAASCETDFVSRGEAFGKLASDVIAALKAGKADSIETLRSDAVLKMGENIRINTDVIAGEAIGFYIHTNGKVAAVVTGKAGTDAEKLRDVAMHVTATNPQALSVASIPAEVIAKEKEIGLEQMKNDPKNAGKPAEMLEKIITGKLRKFAEENALLSQAFVKDPSVTVDAYVGAGNLVSFKRVSVMA